MVVDSGAAENVMPRSMFPEIGIRQTERSKNGKRVQRTRRREHQELWATSHVRQTLEGFARKSTWQVVDVRRPLVSASHVIQAGNDLFMEKDEAYIMNRKKEKSVLRKKGHVYVLDLFVRVVPSVTAPVTYTPMEVDAINQVAYGRERGRRVTFDCSSPSFSR